MKAKITLVIIMTLLGVIFVSVQPQLDALTSIQTSPRPTATNRFHPTARPKPTVLPIRVYLPIVFRGKR